MKIDKRIIKYLEGELPEDEKTLFEKDLSRSETLRNELADYKKVLTMFDDQKLFDTESTYFTNLVPSIREKLEQRKTINPFRKIGYAAGFLLLQGILFSSRSSHHLNNLIPLKSLRII